MAAPSPNGECNEAGIDVFRNVVGKTRSDGDLRGEPFVIAVAGGTASGKTTVCTQITQSLADQRVVMISQDSFYRDLTDDERQNVCDYNFDDPSAFDIPTMIACLDQLKRRESVQVPEYDFASHRRRGDTTRNVKPADVIIVEGILVLYMVEIRNRCDMKIFVDTDADVRLSRRITRDTCERGRDVESVIAQYTRFVKPAFDMYVKPSKNWADVVIPWSGENLVAVSLITEHIHTKLSQHEVRRSYHNLCMMPSTMQTRGMHTIIRSKDTDRQDFTFYADRIIRMLVETALGYLPFSETTVTTPTAQKYSGVSFARKLCGVSIVRSGEAMETALRACCMGIKIGKILVDRRHAAGGPAALVYERLPEDIAERHVLLMDPILATGNSVLCALDLLINQKKVDERKIILLSLIAAPEGIHSVCSRHPNAKVIVSEIDDTIDSDLSVVPGIGDFGDRYFGTDESVWK